MPEKANPICASELADLLPRVEAGERLTRSDLLRLWRTPDLTNLSFLANLRRERVAGNRTHLRAELHVNWNRSPAPECPGCSASASGGTRPFSVEEWNQLLESVSSGDTADLHLIVGQGISGSTSELCALLQTVRARRPRLSRQAFTWADLERAAARDSMTPGTVLEKLRADGLQAIAGGSIIDFTPEKPRLTRESLVQIEQRIPWIQTAAEMGLKSDLSWIYGDEEDPDLIADALLCIRGIQDRYSLFTRVEPLLFCWSADNVAIPMPTGYNQLRAIAVARLFLDNIPHVRGSIGVLSESLMQIAQWYGADEAGASAVSAHGPGGASPSIERVQELIRETGRDPVLTPA